jgi:hypothetical protein
VPGKADGIGSQKIKINGNMPCGLCGVYHEKYPVSAAKLADLADRKNG